jgi:hypothetical protein
MLARHSHAHAHPGHAGHGHSHGLVDESIKRSRAGLRAVALALLVPRKVSEKARMGSAVPAAS